MKPGGLYSKTSGSECRVDRQDSNTLRNSKRDTMRETSTVDAANPTCVFERSKIRPRGPSGDAHLRTPRPPEILYSKILHY
jgi:hypothetical protein